MKGTPSVPHADTLDRLNSGSVTFSGDHDALYERHLTFDHVVPVTAATPRVKFEAVARSVRGLLSQRWINTEQIYQTRNAKTRLLPVARIPSRKFSSNRTIAEYARDIWHPEPYLVD
jgi:glucan phosphorylase